jgi:DNA-binding Lrp family transcriptional regulator
MTDFVTLDEFDRRLLARARRDNQEPARVTAQAVGLSESAVLRRMRRLRAEVVIVADVALVDPARITAAVAPRRIRLSTGAPRNDFNVASSPCNVGLPLANSSMSL